MPEEKSAQAEVEQLETPLEPEEIRDARKLLDRARELLDSGEVESISIYLQRRDETYQTLQSRGIDKHAEAGMLLEFAVQRLSFTSHLAVESMIAESEK